MSLSGPHSQVWRRDLAAVTCVTATYVYFLLFAEFGFVELTRQATASEEGLQHVLGVLGGAGIAGGFLAAAAVGRVGCPRLLSLSFLGCVGGALASLGPSPGGLYGCALLIGLSLGSATVSLSCGLKAACGSGRLAWVCAAGTGLAYALCNGPGVFDAPSRVQALIAAGAAVVGLLGARFLGREGAAGAASRPSGSLNRWSLGAVFLGLVWLDSAGFYVVQHTPALRAATWGSPALLLQNAATHLAGALAAGWALQRGRVAVTLVAATLALMAADGLIASGDSLLLAAVSPLYTIGVSAYSVSLVYAASVDGAALFCACLYGVSGWMGSALGIGLVAHAHTIPGWLALVAGGVIAAALAVRWLQSGRGPALIVSAALVVLGVRAPLRAESPQVAQGREVYLAEGCITCHSQYIRPNVATDVLWWGPASSLAARLAEEPPLFGLRRQGPDLANVGNRRSAEWERLHLRNPQALAQGSRMPRYERLFDPGDGRGEALVAYLCSLGSDTISDRLSQTAAWKPDPIALNAPSAADAGRALYAHLCSSCHGLQGKGDGALASSLSTRPPDFTLPTWRHVPESGEGRRTSTARLIKFGLPGTAMAGHEYLPDQEVIRLADYVIGLHAKE